MSKQYSFFLKHLGKSKKTILDLGCGSGRDSIYFKSKGYNVYAIDPEKKFIDHVKSLGIENAFVLKAEEMLFEDSFDGIWACASLLHISYKNLKEVFKRCFKALKESGVMYVSFKYGDFEGLRDGRFYLDLTLKRLQKCLEGSGLVVVDSSISIDVRNDNETKWLNAILVKDVVNEKFINEDEDDIEDFLNKMNISYAISDDNVPDIRSVQSSKVDVDDTNTNDEEEESQLLGALKEFEQIESSEVKFQSKNHSFKRIRTNKGHQLRIIDPKTRRRFLNARRRRQKLLDDEHEEKPKEKQIKGVKVNYSLVSESAIKKNSNFIISLTMFEDKFRKIAKKIKKQFESPNEKKGTLENIAYDTNILVVMSSDDIPSIKDKQEFTWLGKYYTCEFSGFVPKEYDKNSFVISFDIYVNGVKVTRIKTIINLKNNSAGMLVFSKEDVKRIFFSYSSQDRDIVLNIVDKINKSFNYDIDFFLDVLSLRAGDNWEERIYNEINLSDTFCLIWSKNAYGSTWVEIEWKYALKKKGLGCINPINLEPNDKSLPIPKELEKIHFAYYPLLK